MEAIVMVGVSGSGKSTKARSLVAGRPNWAIVERDQVRLNIAKRDLHLSDVGNLWNVWDWSLEDLVTSHIDAQLQQYSQNATNVIVADTNTSAKTRNKMIKKLTGLGYVVSIHPVDVPLETAISRDKKRQHTVGESGIRNQYTGFVQYMTSEQAK